MKSNVRKIIGATCGERIFSRASVVADYHRIQASTGYRDAAVRCNKMLSDAGVASQIRSYEYDGSKMYFQWRTFLEWDCRSAKCELTYPKNVTLADFDACNISVMQKSHPCKHDQLEVVLMDKGSLESAYSDVDLTGKVIFAREHFSDFMPWAFHKKGAVGIITDYMREVAGVRTRADMADERNYTSFWWNGSSAERDIFGFVLSPKLGDSLAAICADVADEHEKDASKPRYPSISCHVDASLYKGAIEVVDAFLPGESDEEVILTAHLCHPRASANDNASGVACGIEALQVIKNLIDKGELAPLKRGIRLLLVPEFSGTYSYAAENQDRFPKILAGLNLDMVGGRQGKGYGPIAVTDVPHALPSFVSHVASLVLDEIKKECSGFRPGSSVSMFSSVLTEFSTGSDHFIFSDPSVGIPTPMLGQWPDKNYHTSGDTIDVLCPHILHKSACIAAGYAYSIANMQECDAALVCHRIQALFAVSADKKAHTALESGSCPHKLYAELEHLAGFYKGCVADLRRLFGTGAADKYISTCAVGIDAARKLAFEGYAALSGHNSFVFEPKPLDARFAYAPQRLFIAPIVHINEIFIDNPEFDALYIKYKKEHADRMKDAATLETLICYYMDGSRTTAEIAQQIQLEYDDGDAEMVDAFISLLRFCKLVK